MVADTRPGGPSSIPACDRRQGRAGKADSRRPQLADLSDTYTSQLERGMHEPSIRVLRAVADSLGIRASQLIMYAAGLPLGEEDDDITTEEAIRRDPCFTDAQRQAGLGVGKSCLASNQT